MALCVRYSYGEYSMDGKCRVFNTNVKWSGIPPGLLRVSPDTVDALEQCKRLAPVNKKVIAAEGRDAIMSSLGPCKRRNAILDTFERYASGQSQSRARPVWTLPEMDMTTIGPIEGIVLSCGVFDDVRITVVHEPSTWLLFAVGIVFLLGIQKHCVFKSIQTSSPPIAVGKNDLVNSL